MKDINYFKKQQDKEQRELDKLSSDLNDLQVERAELDKKINAAIDGNDAQTVTKLTAKMMELDSQMNAVMRIIARKKETSSVSRKDVAEANNTEMDALQKELNTVLAEMEKTRKEYLSKAVSAARIVNAAWDKRSKYLLFVKDNTPWKLDSNNIDFSYVSFENSLLWLTSVDNIYMREHDPDGLIVISDALRH